jgi:hypothetical protein
MINRNFPRRIVARHYDWSVQDIVRKIKAEDIELHPDCQRNHAWDTNTHTQNKCSRLIESLLLNIPIPGIYFAEQVETLKYEIIDGQQRLFTFYRYLNNEFPLEGLIFRGDVSGKKYSELERCDREEIRKSPIRVIVIPNDSDEEIKHEVFERLNLGSIQLTSQEIRNNILRGSFNDLLKKLADNDLFQNMVHLGLKSDQKKMAHKELVLRFFAHHNSGFKRTKPLSLFLTSYMEEMKDLPSHDINKLEDLFVRTINLIHVYLEELAFLLFDEKTNEWNGDAKKLLYDAEMLAFSQFIDKEIKISPRNFREALQKLMSDNAFKKYLNDKYEDRAIAKRVSAIKNILANK